MKIIKGQEERYEDYKTQSSQNEFAQRAFEYAKEYANCVEELLEKKVEICEAFEQAYTIIGECELSGVLKNYAYSVLTKTWEHGAKFEDYNVNECNKYEA